MKDQNGQRECGCSNDMFCACKNDRQMVTAASVIKELESLDISFLGKYEKAQRNISSALIAVRAEAIAEGIKIDKLRNERDAAREMARDLAKALESIAEYWNGGENSAVDAAEEMRLRALEALSLYSKEK